MKNKKTISSHNHFIGAVWAAVHCAQKSRNNKFRVVQLPGQKRWSVVDQQFCLEPTLKVAFAVKSYRTKREHITACGKAGTAIRKWQEVLYREFTSTGDTKCIPCRAYNNTHEQLLLIAVKYNNPTAVELLIKAHADVNYATGRPLRTAVKHNHQAVVLALLNAGASIKTTEYFSTPKRWTAFLANVVAILKTANFDENLAVFDELAEIACDPACRPTVLELAQYYPSLLAKLI